jgi:cytochrome c oxidase assembly protein subunit 15
MPRQSVDPWPHRLAWLLACTTFLLINVGGTVTTYEAGMAVPDWPTTYGHWFYPIQLWLTKGWDVFLEHGHRMLAALVGILTIALVSVLWIKDQRKWLRWLAVAMVAGVVFQVIVGGLRVVGDQVVGWLEAHQAPGMSLLCLIGDDVLLRRLHGCTAPLFFSLCTALVTLTSRAWLQRDKAQAHPAARQVQRLAGFTTLALYLQIVLGAQLRHLSPDSRPGWFEFWVWLKLITAGLIAAGVVWLLIYVLRRAGSEAMIIRRTKMLAAMFFLQLLLGAGAWVTNFGFPAWFRNYIWATSYTVVAEGPLQVITTTAHAAVGSLNLVAALSLTLWSRRLWRDTPRQEGLP